MSSSPEETEFRCFVGGLSWSTTDRGLEDAFRPCSSVLNANVMVDRDTGRSRGFGFVTFGDERSMDEAIHRLHGKDLDGRPITVNKAKPKSKGGSDRYAPGRSGGGGCFKCGEPGHWARECNSSNADSGGSGAASSRYVSRGEGDRHGTLSKSGDRHSRNGRSSDRYYGGSDSYVNGDVRGAKDSWRSSRDRGERYSSSGGSQSKAERSGPYDRPSRGSGASYDDRH